MKIAVLIGGTSEERDVSMASGAQVLSALAGRGHTVLALDTVRGVLGTSEQALLFSSSIPALPPETDGAEEGALLHAGTGALATDPSLQDIDVLFIALHGGTGEDGTLQAVLDASGIPYTGSTHMPSVYAMDKDVAKRLFRQAGIPTPDWIMAPCSASEVEDSLGFPVVVKPNRQGSTIGLTLVPSTVYECRRGRTNG